jgi:hypothetical protein
LPFSFRPAPRIWPARKSSIRRLFLLLTSKLKRPKPENRARDRARENFLDENAPDERTPRAAVLTYRVGGVDWIRNSRYGGSLNEDRIGESMARAVAEAVRKANRFVVREVGAPRDWAVFGESAFQNLAAGEWVFDGRIDDIEIETRCERTRKYRNDSHDRKGERHRDEYDESYTTIIEFTVHHRAQAPDGTTWRSLDLDRKFSVSSSTQPRARELSKRIEKSALGTVSDWVRMLVREKRGKVTGRNGTRLILDLGRRDGVDGDVDFVFERAANDGLLGIAARPDADHDSVFACIARPVRVEETWCEVEVGYNGSGGLFGPDVKWKKRDAMSNAVAAGDIAVLTSRAYGAK